MCPCPGKERKLVGSGRTPRRLPVLHLGCENLQWPALPYISYQRGDVISARFYRPTGAGCGQPSDSTRPTIGRCPLRPCRSTGHSVSRFQDIEGVNPVPLPPKSPNLNAHLERFFGSLKSECLRRIIFFGEQSLRKAVQEFVRHYHEERNHQGLENKIIDPGDEVGQVAGSIASHERLGGILRYYYRDAA